MVHIVDHYGGALDKPGAIAAWEEHMSNFSRRTFVTTALGGAAALAMPGIRRAEAASFNYKYANNLQLSHPLNIRAKEAADAIAEETGGDMKIQIFPSSQLGGDTETLSQLRAGAVEFFTLSGLILSTLVPVTAINGVGFAFPDYGTVWKAMDGELGAHVRGEISKYGILAMEKIWDNGFRQTTSRSKPIETPADLEGFKIRVPVSPLWTSMYEAFGAAPTSINFSEVYTSLQTGVVEGQENPLAILQTAKLYEVQKYCSMTNHMWDGFWFLANQERWEALPEDIRNVVAKHLNAAAVKERADVEALNASLAETLQEEGMAFNSPEAGPFREKLRSAKFYETWQEKFGPTAWGLLEQAVGKLA
ncbi:tripartite ATP-independent transporter DctP family solute receptor [Breoghania corrubedonensis]|uniref:Tripartite ATP-independent transporter DctP family solute receptor n=2 Tax=Breoghania corrubedonensis TaxID=665038 RepID=A0A2T5VC89_9HYPH|nr:tripartite ATP-independent transporter DctP family solute receptor [Breoghania corrubedonensis]